MPRKQAWKIKLHSFSAHKATRIFSRECGEIIKEMQQETGECVATRGRRMALECVTNSETYQDAALLTHPLNVGFISSNTFHTKVRTRANTRQS